MKMPYYPELFNSGFFLTLKTQIKKGGYQSRPLIFSNTFDCILQNLSHEAYGNLIHTTISSNLVKQIFCFSFHVKRNYKYSTKYRVMQYCQKIY
jgi:hypothetical protein